MSKSKNEIEETKPAGFYQFNKDQIIELKKSEEDIKYGRVISQENLDREDLEWLNQL